MRIVVATVLFGAQPSEVMRWINAVWSSGLAALEDGLASHVQVLIGDCGSPELDHASVTKFPSDRQINYEYRPFGANLGHSKGCNVLAEGLSDYEPADVVIFLNPDALPEERAVVRMAEVLQRTDVGVVDARQIPAEHPKWFDPITGEQSWASGACLGIRVHDFQAVGGFDDVHFWSYCNDVDLSWRMRMRGLSAVHVPEAVIFHDKRLDALGQVIPTGTQEYFSTLGRLHLATRFDRPDIVRRTARWIESHGSGVQRSALAEFRSLESGGLLPRALPGAGSVAQFVGGEYAEKRF